MEIASQRKKRPGRCPSPPKTGNWAVRDLLELAEAEGVSRQELARRADLPRTTVNSWALHGREPSFRAVCLCYQALGYDLDFVRVSP